MPSPSQLFGLLAIAVTAIADILPTPDGYEMVFGAINRASSGAGYMGYRALQSYDVGTCASSCNTRALDFQGGACQFFNIWAGVVNNVTVSYTCSMYYVPGDASTANNRRQGNITVSQSRGYRRTSLVVGGGFENVASVCGPGPAPCWVASTPDWIGTTPSGGQFTAFIYRWAPYAHSGSAIGVLGELSESTNFPGTLTPTQPLQTIAGKTYIITFFYNSELLQSGPEVPFLEVMWNGAIVTTINARSLWTPYGFTVTAVGSDVLVFHGGGQYIWIALDDISVFEM